MSSPLLPLVVLSAPTLLIAAASISLHQFKVFFVAFVNLAARRQGSAAWKLIQPTLSNVASAMEGTLGTAAGFHPNVTHVMLVATMLAVIVGAERVRGAVLEKRR
ncbi:uncharacterized protein MICPUCDRAFT_54205 [Micromonas pusilla CCMP1545]|jgi:hypothetical protein|uniref:Predicted protein n=1 Tax=Micromonas pusilla (strain CCMP1545) TaxID=564608 RepID=C1N8Q6_MICPC|nr:uncharacterized protein MICPUCDRAFT_54205 [Micromonas pusilla CCMP1545]EEH51393.1 predicted protein [Micromonas pusilla CCMP1545]|tara:strand:+ start:1824 stop:2138 length:315 start_codon:yes stop_codon:yes gene_type:complete|eukprot:XP_003064488.1 predicted protein [Micromonas pusilla CCMP1545]